MNKTSSSITLSFNHDDAVEDDLKEFYKYYIEIKLSSEPDESYAIASEPAIHVRFNYKTVNEIDGLRYNTEYEFRTLLRKEQYGNFEVCDYSPRTIRETTECESK